MTDAVNMLKAERDRQLTHLGEVFKALPKNRATVTIDGRTVILSHYNAATSRAYFMGTDGRMTSADIHVMKIETI